MTKASGKVLKLLDALDNVRPSGDGWSARCPAHEDRRNSLSIAEGDDGRVLLLCHAGCDLHDILAEIGLTVRDLFLRKKRGVRGQKTGRHSTRKGLDDKHKLPKPATSGAAGPWRRVTTYVYKDESGSPLFRVVRLKRGKGAEREKGFFQERYDDGSWVKGLGDVRRVPYQLDRVVDAKRIYIVEGEKDCRTLRKFGVVATTCPMGAGKWLPEYTPHFTGKKVIILPDNDPAGRAHAAQVAEALLSVAKSVHVVQLPDLPEKGDVTDWVQAGGTRDQLKSLAHDTPPLDAAGLTELKERWGLNDKQVGAFLFRVDEEGLFFLDSADGGKEIKLAAPIDVLAQTRDVASENWGRLLEWRDNEDSIHQWAMPMEMLATDAGAVRGRLLSDGLPFITTNPRLRERLNEYLQTAPVDRTVRCVGRIGWHGRTYALPDKTIGPDNAEETRYQSPHEAVHHWKTRGNVDKWREVVGQRCGGNSRLILAVGCGFAGPLLKLLGAESGGINLHGPTSTGKTTALIVGGSVCGGGGQAGFVQTWRTTINGLEAVAETHNDATLFLDEISQVDPHAAGETAYLLGNGQGKARMTRTIGARRKLNWNLLYMSAGEVTLAEHAASAGRRTRGGAEVRLLNIDADAGKGLGLFEHLHGAARPDAFCREMKQAALRCYGSPFRAFLYKVTRNRKWVKRFAKKFRKTFKKSTVPKETTGEVLRAADRFALVGAAGELATRWGLTGWQEGEARRAVKRLFGEWLQKRGTKGSSDMETAVQQVRAFLQTHGESRFQKHDNTKYGDKPQITRDRAGFSRHNPRTSEIEYLIFPAVFKSEICAGYSALAVLRELEARGYLVRNPPNLTIKPRLGELGPVRVHCIRAAILKGDKCVDPHVGNRGTSRDARDILVNTGRKLSRVRSRARKQSGHDVGT